MTTRSGIKFGGLPLAASVCLLAICLSCGCRVKFDKAPTLASLCNLRNKPETFSGKIVRTSGWIYTDLEHFGLEDKANNCGVVLDYSKVTPATESDLNFQQFKARIATAKHGTFDTTGQVFAIVEGEFATYGEWKDRYHPGTLLIEKIVCSADVSKEKSTEAEAMSQCGKQSSEPPK